MILEFIQTLIGILLWFVASAFVVLGLGFIGHRYDAILAPPVFLIAAFLIWFGFWFLV